MKNKNNQEYINFFYGLLVLYFCWISFYGALNLIINHGNNFKLANPDLPIWLKIIDELILMFILATIGLLYKLKIVVIKLNHKFYLTILPLIILSFFQFLAYIYTLDFKYILLCKNSLTAISITWVLFVMFELNLLKKITKLLLFILTLSVLVSLFHYLIYPYEVYGTRLIGTYANPNVLGYVCFFGIVLANYAWFKGSKIAKYFILIFAIGEYASGSLSASLILFLYLFSKLLIHYFYDFKSKIKKKGLRILCLTILIVFCGYILSLTIFNSAHRGELVQKAISLSSFLNKHVDVDLSESNSLNQRFLLFRGIKDEFQHFRGNFLSYFQSDSTFFNLIHNYPVFFFYIFTASFLYSFYYKFLKDKKVFILLLENPISYFVLFSIFPYIFVQYVLEEIPSLIFFYYAYTLLIIDITEAEHK